LKPFEGQSGERADLPQLPLSDSSEDVGNDKWGLEAGPVAAGRNPGCPEGFTQLNLNRDAA